MYFHVIALLLVLFQPVWAAFSCCVNPVTTMISWHKRPGNSGVPYALCSYILLTVMWIWEWTNWLCVCVCVCNCSVKFVVVTVQAFNTRTSISSLPVCCRQQAQLCTITDSRYKYVCYVHVSAFGMSDLWQHAATWMHMSVRKWRWCNFSLGLAFVYMLFIHLEMTGHICFRFWKKISARASGLAKWLICTPYRIIFL